MLCAICTLLLCLMRSTTSSPFVERNFLPIGTDADDEGLSSDAGPVDSCEVPNAPICGVLYSVPGSVARIAAAIELDIEGTFGEAFDILYSPGCTETAKRITCAQRFPRCEVLGNDSVQVTLTSLLCEDMLIESCGNMDAEALIAQGHCALQNSTQNAARCRSIAEHAAEASPEERELQHCTQNQQWQVTAWMYEQVKYYDALFAGRVEDVRTFYPSCVNHWSNFTCHLVGKCSEDGQRVELINTYEICERFINCFPDSFADSLRERYDCDQWPHQTFNTSVPTTSTSTTTSSTTTTSTSSTTISTSMPPPSTWPHPPATVDMVSGGASHSIARLPLAVLIASLLLPRLQHL